MFGNAINILKNFGRFIIRTIRSVGVKLDKDATGETLGSLQQEIFFNVGGETVLEITGSKVFDYIEEGRAAGAKLPPEGVLLKWMAARNINDVPEFVIRRAIAINGIKATPLIENSLKKVQAQLNQRLSQKLADEITKKIQFSIQTGLKFPDVKIV